MLKSFLPLLISRFWYRRLPESIFPQKIVLKKASFQSCGLQVLRISCTFALFFMVLDLRLVKIGCRETINFFCTYTKKQGAGDVSPQVYRRNRIIRQLKFLKTSLQAAQPPYFEIATLHHVLPRHAGRVWLACRRTVPYWLLANPAPRANVPRCRRGRISVQMRLHLVPDAVASGPACADNHYPSFFPPLPTFQHSNEAPIRRKEGTIKRERVISLPWHVPNSLSNCLIKIPIT